jgi:hypothetical protein
VKPVQTVTAAKILNILDGIEGCGAWLANADEFLHGLHLLIAPAEVPLPNGFAHEFGDGSLPTARTSVEGIPKVFVKVQLRAPHNVYYTSRRAGQD